jgi:hypothetical protein
MAMRILSTFLMLFIYVAFLHAQTQRISFVSPGLYPEGVAYDPASNSFFVSSSTTATIGKVDKQGNYTIFYREPDLKSSFGMKVDAKTGTLWVCTGDPNNSIYKTSATFKKQIRLVGLDLKTGKKLADIDLSNLVPGNHFANDITLDEAGNKYITDSYSPVIYRVDASGKATVFAQNDLFKGVGIGLNGIAWSKAGYLLAVNDANGNILKITTTHPVVTEVAVPHFFPGADGILLVNDTLYVVQNKGVNAVTQVVSQDDWKTGSVTGASGATDRFQNPSTLTRSAVQIYALNAKLNELSDSTLPKSKEFSLQLVICKPVKN